MSQERERKETVMAVPKHQMSSNIASPVEVGARLREARQRARIRQDHAAEGAGVSDATLRRWENGRAKGYPDLGALSVLAKMYGVTVEALISPTPGWWNRGSVRNHLTLVSSG